MAVSLRRLALVAVALIVPLLLAGCAGEIAPGEEESGTSLEGPSVPSSVSDERGVAQPSSPGAEAFAGGGEAVSPQVAGASIERKVVQTASMTLQVKSVSQAFQEAGRIAAASGGLVASSSFSNEGEEQVASVTIRVPAVRFQQALADLRALAVQVDSEQSEATDVTEEFADLGARLRNLEATEAQYLEFLKQAKDIGEVLQVQDRLTSVRGEIEQVRGRMNLLDSLAEMSTVTVHLRPETAAAADSRIDSPGDAARAAWDASIDTLEGIAIAIAAIAAFSWWLVPLLILLAVLGRALSPRLQGPTKR